jgi:hypothetical protein
MTLTDPQDFGACILDRAKRFGVVSAIHSDDYIFQFLITNQSFQRKEDAVNYYFEDGQNSSTKLQQLVSRFVQPATHGRQLSVLEFASGYGCVSRHLVKHFGQSVTSVTGEYVTFGATTS